MKNKISLFFLLIFVANYLLAMEQNIKDEIMKKAKLIPGAERQVEIVLEDLPDETLTMVLTAFTQLENAPEIKDAINAINSLRLVSKRFKDLIDDPVFANNLLKHLSQRFGISRYELATHSNIPAIKDWLKKGEKQLRPIFQGLRLDKKITHDAVKEKLLKELIPAMDKDYINEPWGELGHLAIPIIFEFAISTIMSDDLAKLLIKKGADINLLFRGETPLTYVISRIPSPARVKILLENNADPNKRVSGGSPLSIANEKLEYYLSTYGPFENFTQEAEKTRELLLEYGANE